MWSSPASLGTKEISDSRQTFHPGYSEPSHPELATPIWAHSFQAPTISK